MNLIFSIHSHTRWLVAGILLLAIIKVGITVLRRQEFGRGDGALTSAAVGMLDLQVLVGVIYLIGTGAYDAQYRIEHVVTMLLAVIGGHMISRFSKHPGAVRARRTFVALLVVALLVFVGVMRLPGNGWTRGMDRTPQAPMEVLNIR